MRTWISAIGAAICLCCSVASSGSQDRGPEAVVQRFVNAWNSHDMAAFRQLFADDALWVPVAESRLQGRAAILKDFTLIHTTWAKTTTIAASEVTVQKLSPTVSALFLRLRYLDAEGHTSPGVNHAVLIVAVKESGLWKIAAGQITKLTH